MTTIALLTGGASAERFVALAGAGMVASALRSNGHHVRCFDTCTGELSDREERELMSSDVGRAYPSAEEILELEAQEDLVTVVTANRFLACELAFIVLHGRTGEGGQVQALLDAVGMLYVGSDPTGSAVAMDKDLSKRLFREAGIPTPKGWLVSEDFEISEYPVVVKPSRVGSTVGLSIVESSAGLEEAIAVASRYDSDVLIEEFLSGRELTVGVLGGEALAVGEIVTPTGLFDFESKYTPGIAQEIFPAAIDDSLTERLRSLSLAAHRALKLRDFSRVDFRLDGDGLPYCLEVNTLPGMTPTSLLPQSAAVSGVSFEELCERIVELALERRCG